MNRPFSHKKVLAGFTLVEILISLLLFGIVLTLVAQMTASQNKMNTAVMQASSIADDAQLATVRMTELLSQAAYIYPEGQTITLPGGAGTVVTGKKALAFLLASGTPYCTASSQTYCAVVYRVEARGGYVSILGTSNVASPYVLTESVYKSLSWSASGTGTYPTRNWSALTLVGGAAGLVADTVDDVNTDLGTSLTVASRSSSFDEGLKIGVPDTDAAALIQAVNAKLQLTLTNGRKAIRTFSVMAQPVPRQSPL